MNGTVRGASQAMNAATTVAVLYPGEMGAVLAGLLMRRGARVVTTLQGRGPSTVQRCRETGVIELDSLRQVVREAAVVFSLVPPAQAQAMARAYCELAHLSPPGALYVDANSIGPGLAESLSAQLAEHGRGFVDAAINGLAANAASGGTLFLSGPRAAEVAELVTPAMRVQVLGDGPAAASALKMALGGLAKGLCSLFVETALLADCHKMLPQMLEATAGIYPGVYAIVQRMLPTYALHAERRATEMAQVEQTLRAAGVEPVVIEAVRKVHQRWAAAGVDSLDGSADGPVAAILRHLSASAPQPDQPPAGTTDPAKRV